LKVYAFFSPFPHGTRSLSVTRPDELLEVVLRFHQFDRMV